MDATAGDGGAAAGTALGEHDCNEIISFQEVAEYKDLLTLLQHLGHGITVHYNEHISKLKIIGDKNSGRSLHAPRGGEVGNIPNTVISTDIDKLDTLMAKIPKDSDLTTATARTLLKALENAISDLRGALKRAITPPSTNITMKGWLDSIEQVTLINGTTKSVKLGQSKDFLGGLVNDVNKAVRAVKNACPQGGKKRLTNDELTNNGTILAMVNALTLYQFTVRFPGLFDGTLGWGGGMFQQGTQIGQAAITGSGDFLTASMMSLVIKSIAKLQRKSKLLEGAGWYVDHVGIDNDWLKERVPTAYTQPLDVVFAGADFNGDGIFSPDKSLEDKLLRATAAVASSAGYVRAEKLDVAQGELPSLAVKFQGNLQQGLPIWSQDNAQGKRQRKTILPQYDLKTETVTVNPLAPLAPAPSQVVNKLAASKIAYKWCSPAGMMDGASMDGCGLAPTAILRNEEWDYGMQDNGAALIFTKGQAKLLGQAHAAGEARWLFPIKKAHDDNDVPINGELDLGYDGTVTQGMKDNHMPIRWGGPDYKVNTGGLNETSALTICTKAMLLVRDMAREAVITAGGPPAATGGAGGAAITMLATLCLNPTCQATGKALAYMMSAYLFVKHSCDNNIAKMNLLKGKDIPSNGNTARPDTFAVLGDPDRSSVASGIIDMLLMKEFPMTATDGQISATTLTRPNSAIVFTRSPKELSNEVKTAVIQKPSPDGVNIIYEGSPKPTPPPNLYPLDGARDAQGTLAAAGLHVGLDLCHDAAGSAGRGGAFADLLFHIDDGDEDGAGPGGGAAGHGGADGAEHAGGGSRRASKQRKTRRRSKSSGKHTRKQSGGGHSSSDASGSKWAQLDRKVASSILAVVGQCLEIGVGLWTMQYTGEKLDEGITQEEGLATLFTEKDRLVRYAFQDNDVVWASSVSLIQPKYPPGGLHNWCADAPLLDNPVINNSAITEMGLPYLQARKISPPLPSGGDGDPEWINAPMGWPVGQVFARLGVDMDSQRHNRITPKLLEELSGGDGNLFHALSGLVDRIQYDDRIHMNVRLDADIEARLHGMAVEEEDDEEGEGDDIMRHIQDFQMANYTPSPLPVPVPVLQRWGTPVQYEQKPRPAAPNLKRSHPPGSSPGSSPDSPPGSSPNAKRTNLGLNGGGAGGAGGGSRRRTQGKKGTRGRKVTLRKRRQGKSEERRWKTLGFYECREKLFKARKKLGGEKKVWQLVQADDTDFPHFSPSQKGWTFEKIHSWMNDKKRSGLSGVMSISKPQLKLALKICASR